MDKFKYFLMCINREMLQYQKQFCNIYCKNNGNKKGTIKKYKTVRNVTPMWFKDYDCDTNVTAILHLPKTP